MSKIKAGFKVGDKVQVRNEWISEEAKTAIGVIDRFQINGTIKFAVLKWARELSIDNGNIFPIDELRKV